MSTPIIKYLILFIGINILMHHLVYSQGSQLNGIEYFWDVDPGIGEGSFLSLLETNNLDTTLLIPLESLNSGIHVLGARAFSDSTGWGLTSYRGFLIEPSLPDSMILVEWFIGKDPGIGNSSFSKKISSETIKNNDLLLLDLGDLGAGVYSIGMRLKFVDNTWSQTHTRSFLLDYAKAPIKGIEYYWNQDAGLGLGTEIYLQEGFEIFSTLAINSENRIIDVDTAFVRAYDSLGTYSLTHLPGIDTLSDTSLELKVFPNPVDDKLFTIQGEVSLGQELTIWFGDITGKEIFVDIISPINVSFSKEIELPEIPEGLYLIRIVQGVSSKSFILVVR